MREPADQSSDTTQAEQGLFPIDPRVYTTLFYLMLLIWIVLLLYTSLDWRRDDRLFPMLIGIPLVTLLILQLFKLRYSEEFERIIDQYSVSFSLSRGTDGSDEEPQENLKSAFNESFDVRSDRSKAEREKYELIMIGWAIAFPVFVYYLGFVLVIPPYIFLFGLFFLKDIKLATFMTVFASIGIYVLFIIILDVSLWPGVFDPPTPSDFIRF